MRGGSNLKMGVPNGGGQGDHRPSKLEMMREDYHKKILKEKEERMVQMYEDSQMSQKKTMLRMMRNGSGEGRGGVVNDNHTAGGGTSVRDFFNERRRMEASGVPVPPIDDHFRKAKGYSSPGGWSSRTGSGNSAKKFSAGRDRSQPLAPIRRPTDTREMARTGNTPRSQPNSGYGRGGGGGAMNGDSNPFNSRPKLAKPKPLPPTNGYSSNNQGNQQQQQQQQQNNVDRNNNDKPPGPPSTRFGYQNLHQQRQQHNQQLQRQSSQRPQQQQQQQQQQEQQQQQQQQHHNNRTSSQPHPPPMQQRGIVKPRTVATQRETPKTTNTRGEPKLTDFQKWQMEQNKAREDRLKKLNNPKNQSHVGFDDDDEEDDDDDDNARGNGHDNVRKGGYQHEEEEEEEEEGGGAFDDGDHEVKRMERELLEKIQREKAELDRIRQERVVAEEEEKREMEDMKKREKAERAKQKKLEEQRRKDEERQRKEEEEDERRMRQREEKERKEEEKRQREEEKRRKEEERLAVRREKEEQKRRAQHQKQQPKESARSDYSYASPDPYEDRPVEATRHSPPIPTSAPQTMDAIDNQPVANADASFYAQIARSNEAKGSVGSMSKCKVCGRSFATDRLKKHQQACVKANKPRKEFDSSKKRVEGTEAARYASKPGREPPKKKNNWRTHHEEFINSLRYAKKVAQYEKEGKDLTELAPPPPTHDPDLVPCPYCKRTFNKTSAERHIPRCKDLKTKPPPMNTRKR